jgi:DNA polymerase III delta subunit
MKTLTSDEFLAALKNLPDQGVKRLEAAKINLPLLIEGSDPLRIRRLIDWLQNTLGPGEVSSVLGSEVPTNPQQLRRLLTQSSLFSPLQYVVIYNGEKLKSGAGKAVVEILKNGIAPKVLPIITGESFKNQKLSFLADLRALGSIVVVEELKGAALRKWIEREAARFGGAITPEGAQYLAEHFSEDLTLLSQELQKLTLFVGPQEKIERSLVEEELFQHPERTSFQLVHEIARKNVKNATVFALTLVQQGFHPLQVSTFLSKAFRVLFAHHLQEELSSELGNQWFYKQLAPAQNHFTRRDYLSVFEVLRALDLQLKSSNLSHPLALSLAVEKMALRAWS